MLFNNNIELADNNGFSYKLNYPGEDNFSINFIGGVQQYDILKQMMSCFQGDQDCSLGDACRIIIGIDKDVEGEYGTIFKRMEKLIGIKKIEKGALAYMKFRGEIIDILPIISGEEILAQQYICNTIDKIRIIIKELPTIKNSQGIILRLRRGIFSSQTIDKIISLKKFSGKNMSNLKDRLVMAYCIVAIDALKLINGFTEEDFSTQHYNHIEYEVRNMLNILSRSLRNSHSQNTLHVTKSIEQLWSKGVKKLHKKAA